MRKDHEMDEWLQERINEDLQAMVDKREKYLMESEELKDIHMPIEKLNDLYRLIEEDEAERARAKRRLRLRPILVVAATLVLLLGVGMVGSGNRVYVPEIFRVENDGDVTTKVENSEHFDVEYSEEDVCQEIEEKLGVIVPRLAYKPDGMELSEYAIMEDETIVSYEYKGVYFYMHIFKKHNDATINSIIDGTEVGEPKNVIIESCGIEVPVRRYQDDKDNEILEASFTYLNTYYSFRAMMEKEIFVQIIEDINLSNI